MASGSVIFDGWEPVGRTLLLGVLAYVALVVLQLVNTFIAVRWPWYQRLLKAQPTLVFFKGRMLDSAMRTQRLTRDEVLAAIREQGLARPEQVDAVVLETEGTLSVIRGDAGSAEALARLGVDVATESGTGFAAQSSEPCPHCGRNRA